MRELKFGDDERFFNVSFYPLTLNLLPNQMPI